MTKYLLYNKGSYLMVSIDKLPADVIQLSNKSDKSEFHITIAYEPKKKFKKYYHLNYLNKNVTIITKSISWGEDNISRIDIESIYFEDDVKLNKIDKCGAHITLFVPPTKKPKDAGLFIPLYIQEYNITLTGTYIIKH